MKRRTIPMSEAVVAKLKKLASDASGTLQVGFIDSPQAPIAFWNEFGHGGRFPAPPRPFFRPMVSKDSPHWPNRMAELLKKSNFNGKKTLRKMGEHIDGELKESITEGTFAPLSPVTLVLRHQYWTNPQDIRARDVLAAQDLLREGYGVGIMLKGNRLSRSKKAAPMVSFTQSRPLVWTGQMLNSTSYRVDNGPVMVKSGNKYVERG